MLKRNSEIGDLCEHLDVVDLNEKLLTNREEAKLDTLFQQLEDLNLVTMKLQCNRTTISDEKVLFDAVIENFPELSNRLPPTSTIVENAINEGTIANIQSGEESRLTNRERKTVKHFENCSSTSYQDMIALDISLPKKHF